MNETSSPVALPIYLKLAQIFLGLGVFGFILYIGQDIIVPLVFAAMIAILLNPLVLLMTHRKIPRVIAILLAIVLCFLFIAGIFYFFGKQLSLFSESAGQFTDKFSSFYKQAEHWVGTTFNIPKYKIDAFVNKTKGDGLSSGPEVIGKTVGTIGGMLVTLFIMPVYVFMIIYYKPLLLDFIAQLFPKSKHAVVLEVLLQTKSLIQNYLFGLLVEALLVAVLNSVGLLIIGIQYAILLGVLGALLNIIPYIGGVVATALPMLVALATKTPLDALWVFVAYIVVQFIDNNFFVPKIVASKVKINALVSIIVVLVGNALWGIPGMFLSIPLTAIVKVIFDRVEPLKPYGFLLGDNQPDIGKVIFNVRKRVSRAAVMKEQAAEQH